MDEQRAHKLLLAYERGWLAFSMLMLFVFIALIAYTLVTHTRGVIPAGALEHVDPTTVRTEGPFAQPGVIQTGPNQYTAYVQAFTFGYLPNPIEVPKGAEITFKITSPDVIHGFYVEGTNLNVEVIPGEVSTVKYTFKRAGEYRIVCNQYCGIGHQNMFGKIVVKE
ncbi:MAG: cytochrome c oxidase subunit II [Thermus sp.]|uniref:cupredoxin domain-containing protein n=1 Tax=Thermus sp. TaxID=275 RepID=UPI0033262C15